MTPRQDVAKCEGIHCAYRESCGRFVRPAATGQAWGAFYALPDDDCEFFEPLPPQEAAK